MVFARSTKRRFARVSGSVFVAAMASYWIIASIQVVSQFFETAPILSNAYEVEGEIVRLYNSHNPRRREKVIQVDTDEGEFFLSIDLMKVHSEKVVLGDTVRLRFSDQAVRGPVWNPNRYFTPMQVIFQDQTKYSYEDYLRDRNSYNNNRMFWSTAFDLFLLLLVILIYTPLGKFKIRLRRR